MSVPREPGSRIQIQDVWPSIDCGRYPVKRTIGEPVEVWADVFRDGHDVLGAAVLYRRAPSRRWLEAPLVHTGNDRWRGTFVPEGLGRWQFSVAVWVDRHASWRDELRRKHEAGQADLASELQEGAALLGRGSLDVATALADDSADRSELTTLAKPLEVIVDPLLARFGAWYELFPRSWGGFRGVAQVVPRLAELGFDVLYLPPVHPIGRTNRKGRNNTLAAERGDPGSPWAIGGAEGGHTALHPELGDDRDFERMVVARARAASRSRSTSRSRPRPTTRGWSSTPSGSTAAPTGRSSTRRTRPSATRTSTTSTGRARTGRACGRRCGTRSSTGSSGASASSASTTRTRSRSRSGSG